MVSNCFLRNVKIHVNNLVSHNLHVLGEEEYKHPYIVYVAKGDTVLLEGRTVQNKSDITPERIPFPEDPIPEGTIKVLWRPGKEIKEDFTIDGLKFINVSWWDNGDGFDYAQQEKDHHVQDVVRNF